jgi:hypothetical protein
MLDEDLDPAAAQISILTSVVGNLSTRPLRRILEIHNVSFSPDNNVGQLRKHLKAYLKRLRQGKKLDGLKTNWMDQNNLAKTQRSRERATLCNEWPQLVPKSLKERLIQGFGLRISSESQSKFVCASCSGRTLVKDQRRLGLEDFDLKLLNRPDSYTTRTRVVKSRYTVMQ